MAKAFSILVHLCCLLVFNQLAAGADWPQFRGTNSSGVATGTTPPVEFGPGKNELWRLPIGDGHSSPCIVGNSIFLTTYDKTQRQLALVCIDRSKGAIRWERVIPSGRGYEN